MIQSITRKVLVVGLALIGSAAGQLSALAADCVPTTPFPTPSLIQECAFFTTSSTCATPPPGPSPQNPNNIMPKECVWKPVRPDPCLKAGGFYCGPSPTKPGTGECAFPKKAIVPALTPNGSFPGGSVQPFFPLSATQCQSMNTQQPPSGGCTKPNGTGSWISCGCMGVGGITSGWYCH